MQKEIYYINADPTISLAIKDNWSLGLTLGYGYGEEKTKTQTDSLFNEPSREDYSNTKAVSRAYKVGLQSQYLKPILSNLYWAITPYVFYQNSETNSEETYLGRYADNNTYKERSYEETISAGVSTGLTYFFTPHWAISSDFLRYSYTYTDFLDNGNNAYYYSNQKGNSKENKLSNFTQNLNFSLSYRF